MRQSCRFPPCCLPNFSESAGPSECPEEWGDLEAPLGRAISLTCICSMHSQPLSLPSLIFSLHHWFSCSRSQSLWGTHTFFPCYGLRIIALKCLFPLRVLSVLSNFSKVLGVRMLQSLVSKGRRAAGELWCSFPQQQMQHRGGSIPSLHHC